MGTVHTWADGYGIWHATVPLTGKPGNDSALARRAIVGELAQREGPSFDPARVGVMRELTGDGTARYRETEPVTRELAAFAAYTGAAVFDVDGMECVIVRVHSKTNSATVRGNGGGQAAYRFDELAPSRELITRGAERGICPAP